MLQSCTKPSMCGKKLSLTQENCNVKRQPYKHICAFFIEYVFCFSDCHVMWLCTFTEIFVWTQGVNKPLLPLSVIYWLNTVRPQQNGNIFKSISLNDNVSNIDEISLRYVSMRIIDDKSKMAEVMVCCLRQQTINRTNTKWHHQATMKCRQTKLLWIYMTGDSKHKRCNIHWFIKDITVAS